VEFMSSLESALGGATTPGADEAKFAWLSRSESSMEVLGMPVLWEMLVLLLNHPPNHPLPETVLALVRGAGVV
jgi:hypothetical protein